jgi:hypothetical protein
MRSENSQTAVILTTMALTFFGTLILLRSTQVQEQAQEQQRP